MSLADALSERNGCRAGLLGLAVALDGQRSRIRDTAWRAGLELFIFLDGQHEPVSVESLELLGTWPVRCCKPSAAKARHFRKRVALERGSS